MNLRHERITVSAYFKGDAVGRPCRMTLDVSADRRIRVSGRVVEIARGTVTL